MRKKADWRIRRPLTFVAVAVVAVAAATTGALAPGFLRHTKHPARAVASGGAPVWIAGESAPNGAGHPTVVRPTRSADVRHARANQPDRKGARTNRPRTDANRGLSATVSAGFCAVPGTATMSDSTSIPIWGFAPMPPSNDCADAVAQLPGPEIDVTAGDVVTLNVTNKIPGHTISLEAAGIELAPGSQPDAATDATASITFTASEGTYLYASSGDSGRQQARGLYGALVVSSGTAGQADGVAVDAQKTLVLSEIDPAFNAAPDTFDMNNWHPSRWLINGLDAPAAGVINAPAGQRLLLRYVNAGIDHNTMALLGLHQRIVAEDGFVLANPFDVASETFPAGETADALVTIPASSSSGARFPLYNQNGKPGMTTFLQVP